MGGSGAGPGPGGSEPTPCLWYGLGATGRPQQWKGNHRSRCPPAAESQPPPSPSTRSVLLLRGGPARPGEVEHGGTRLHVLLGEPQVHAELSAARAPSVSSKHSTHSLTRERNKASHLHNCDLCLRVPSGRVRPGSASAEDRGMESSGTSGWRARAPSTGSKSPSLPSLPASSTHL